MTIIEAIVSGIVQGLTEFLPVSSSGHLVFVHHFFGLKEPEILFDISLHVATLGSVVLFFWKDIVELTLFKNVKWASYIVAASVPAVIAALLFEEKVESFFSDPKKVALALLLTGFILTIAHLSQKSRGENAGKSLGFVSGMLVGLAQAFALIPGISRSGATISSALIIGVKAEDAYKFSFLLSVPVIIGAALYKGVISPDASGQAAVPLFCYIAGVTSAFAAGLLSLKILWWFIRERKLAVFAAYCFVIGTLGILWIK